MTRAAITATAATIMPPGLINTLFGLANIALDVGNVLLGGAGFKLFNIALERPLKLLEVLLGGEPFVDQTGLFLGQGLGLGRP